MTWNCSVGCFEPVGTWLKFFQLPLIPNTIRVELFGDNIDAIYEIDPLTGKSLGKLSKIPIYPKSHYVISPDRYDRALNGIEDELEERIAYFHKHGQLLEAPTDRTTHAI